MTRGHGGPERATAVAASVACRARAGAGVVQRAVIDSDQFSTSGIDGLCDDSVRSLAAERDHRRGGAQNAADLIAARPIIETVAAEIGQRAFTGLLWSAVRDVHCPCSTGPGTRWR